MTKKIEVTEQMHIRLEDNPEAMSIVNEMDAFFKRHEAEAKAMRERAKLEFQAIWNRLGQVVGIDGLGTEEGPEARIEEPYKNTLGMTILAVRPREVNPLAEMFSALVGKDEADTKKASALN